MTISQWMNRNSSIVNIGLAFTCGAVSATTIYYTLQILRRQKATNDLKASIPSISADHNAVQLTEYGAARQPSLSNAEDTRSAKIAARARRGDYDEELILEQLARNRVFLKDEGLQKLRDAFVVVVGLGGVGSHCVAALVRSGVSKIRIVDFDQVTLSSLNRHALATLADVGTPKVHCVRRRLEQICPWARIEARNELFSSQNAERLMAGWDYELHGGEEGGQEPDWVIDAIDNIDTKVGLLQYCVLHNIKVISAMGAGTKSDPTRICVGDISTSIEDPLSKATRRRLKMLGISSGVPVVFSTEKPGLGKAELLPVAEEEVEKGDVGDLGVLPEFRVRILPVLGTMPAIFGYTAANYVICSIADYPMEYRVGDRSRDKMYESMLSALQGLEERLARTINGQDAIGLKIPISKDDIAYLVEEVFRGRSVVSGLTTRLVLTRWIRPESGSNMIKTYENEGQKTSNLKPGDLVLMTKEEAQKHEKEVLKGTKNVNEIYEEEVMQCVQKRWLEEKAFDKYR
ncbi:hypothetical protein H2198_007206 [Neophaeococcomyces mojaviensis]|uniref:Uncharacterized protein n=1 Tax=Neophaeococcomyces mojaviensis TaxID=3383035 RepID=A0ACC3A133_9EURO|nr:hypothetical protein H2198_007206 [Knufia sp. JES_112]